MQLTTSSQSNYLNTIELLPAPYPHFPEYASPPITANYRQLPPETVAPSNPQIALTSPHLTSPHLTPPHLTRPIAVPYCIPESHAESDALTNKSKSDQESESESEPDRPIVSSFLEKEPWLLPGVPSILICLFERTLIAAFRPSWNCNAALLAPLFPSLCFAALTAASCLIASPAIVA